MDRRGRDQFVIRYGDETEVCWNDHQKQLAEQVCCSTSVQTADAPALYQTVAFDVPVPMQACAASEHAT